MESPRPDELIARLNRDAAALAARFELRYRAIEAERPRVKRRYGVCYADGTIRIRLRHSATGKPLKYSSLVNTLCHELAHLKHFNHGLRFQRFYRQILEHARSMRIYLPGPELALRIAGLPARFAPTPHATLAERRVAHAAQPAGQTLPPLRRRPPSGPLQLTLFEATPSD